jgi:hypothetical protein
MVVVFGKLACFWCPAAFADMGLFSTPEPRSGQDQPTVFSCLVLFMVETSGQMQVAK